MQRLRVILVAPLIVLWAETFAHEDPIIRCLNAKLVITQLPDGGRLMQCFRLPVGQPEIYQTGPQILTNENGVVLLTANYSMGVPHGDWLEFDEKGALSVKRYFYEGTECGTRVEFAEFGKIAQESEIGPCTAK